MQKDKIILSKLVVLTCTALAVCLSIAFYIVAWQEPSQPAPEANVPTPINTGTLPQSKAGRITATEFYDYNDTNYYLNPSGDSKISGNFTVGNQLCLGADCRGRWPEAGEGGADVTYKKISVSSYCMGKVNNLYNAYCGFKTASSTCPAGTEAIVVDCIKGKERTKGTVSGSFYPCECSATGSEAILKAYAIEEQNSQEGWIYRSRVDGCSYGVKAGVTYLCSASEPCSLLFQCSKQELVGTSTSESCAFSSEKDGGACSATADAQYCQDKCSSAGWLNSAVSACQSNSTLYNKKLVAPWRGCGAVYDIYECDPSPCSSKAHKITCRCWN